MPMVRMAHRVATQPSNPDKKESLWLNDDLAIIDLLRVSGKEEVSKLDWKRYNHKQEYKRLQQCCFQLEERGDGKEGKKLPLKPCLFCENTQGKGNSGCSATCLPTCPLKTSSNNTNSYNLLSIYQMPFFHRRLRPN